MERHPLALGALACPIDGAALSAGDNGNLRCAGGHSFDRSRDGYFNLLLVQHKASRDPGDSKLMVAARRRVLQAGHYAPIASRAAALVQELVPRHANERPLVLDAGCGEGYYLEHIAGECAGRPMEFAGIDISKWAIQAAAKRRVDCFWAVASSKHPPFLPGSVALILTMFGFAVWPEFAKLQAPGAQVLVVDAGTDHLIELREIIYPKVKRSPPPTLSAAIEAGYTLLRDETLQFSTMLTNQAQIADLLTMTPHAHRATAQGQTALKQLETLTVAGDVVFRVLRRNDD